MSCDIVLSAAGVISNLENIGLEEVGIIVEKGRIPVNAWYETNIPGYYAIGDVTDAPALTPVATPVLPPSICKPWAYRPH